MGSCCQKSGSVVPYIMKRVYKPSQKSKSPITSDSFDLKVDPGISFPKMQDDFIVKGEYSKTIEENFQERQLSSENPDIENILIRNKISVNCRKGSKPGKNQDNFVVVSKAPFTIIIVADGHGKDGDKIALMSCDLLKEALLSSINLAKNIEQCIRNSFSQTHRLIKQKCRCLGVDYLISGCTATLALIYSNILYIANLGDSRAIIGKEISNKVLGISVTFDHKAENPGEADRIERNGGVIGKLMKGDSFRVISPSNRNRGIITTRSFGDRDYKTVGVTYTPTVSSFSLKETDKFLLICSDGVWEYVDNNKIAKIIYENIDDPKRACSVLINNAKDSWSIRQDGYVDDMTAVLVVFN